MAQLLQVTHVCDAHVDRGKDNEPGQTRVVGIDGKTYALELCFTCDAKFLEAVRDLLKRHGRLLENNPKLLKQATATPKGATVHQHPAAVPEPEPAAPAEPVTITGPNLAPKAARNGSKGSRRPWPNSDKERRHVCPWCPDARYTSTTALLTHLNNKHGLIGGMAEVFGLICPLCGSDGSPKLGQHLIKRHKGITVADAFKVAMDRGDKHGVAGPLYAKVQ